MNKKQGHFREETNRVIFRHTHKEDQKKYNMKSDIVAMIEYIESKLNGNYNWFPKDREKFLGVCNTVKMYGRMSKKQKVLLTVAYNKIFDKANPYKG